ncbi:MAG: hypothetical protein DME38_01560 [Verrucomicrobia bacterium]|nr:MAG: hypothetical protein DME38_01560 [Verrucomicrobiota bacterium]
MPVWLRQDQVVSYFITLCVENRRPVLDNPATFQATKAFCRANQNWHTAAAVAMPDHFHALICPIKDREARITQFSAGLKRFVRSETHADWRWQDGIFDRLLRKDEFLESKWFYPGKSYARGIGRTVARLALSHRLPRIVGWRSSPPFPYGWRPGSPPYNECDPAFASSL